MSITFAALSQDLCHLVDLFSGKIAGHDPPGLARQRHGVSFTAEYQVFSGYSSFPASSQRKSVSCDEGEESGFEQATTVRSQMSRRSLP